MSTVKFVVAGGRRVPYEVFPALRAAASGVTFVCAPGIGDLRSEYR